MIDGGKGSQDLEVLRKRGIGGLPDNDTLSHIGALIDVAYYDACFLR